MLDLFALGMIWVVGCFVCGFLDWFVCCVGVDSCCSLLLCLAWLISLRFLFIEVLLLWIYLGWVLWVLLQGVWQACVSILGVWVVCCFGLIILTVE